MNDDELAFAIDAILTGVMPGETRISYPDGKSSVVNNYQLARDDLMQLFKAHTQQPQPAHAQQRSDAPYAPSAAQEQTDPELPALVEFAEKFNGGDLAEPEAPVAGDDELRDILEALDHDCGYHSQSKAGCKESNIGVDEAEQAIRTKYRSVEEIEAAIRLVSHRAGLLIQEHMTNFGIDKVAPVGALRVGTNELRQKLNLGDTNEL